MLSMSAAHNVAGSVRVLKLAAVVVVTAAALLLFLFGPRAVERGAAAAPARRAEALLDHWSTARVSKTRNSAGGCALAQSSPPRSIIESSDLATSDNDREQTWLDFAQNSPT